MTRGSDGHAAPDGSPVRVAACRYALTGDPATNRERLLAQVEAALPDADLVVGPEAATTGVDGPAADAAEPLDGPTVSRLRSLVADHGGTVVVGVPERAAGERYNAAVVVDAAEEGGSAASGVRVRAHRQPALARTYGWTTAFGHAWADAFDTAAGRVAVALCAALDVDAALEELRAARPDVVAVPANWGQTGERDALLGKWRERARAVGAPLVVGNVSRPAGAVGFTYDGPAAVVAPGGVRDAVESTGTARATVEA